MTLTETPPLGRSAAAPGVVLTRMRRLLDVSVALNAVNDTDRLLRFIARTTTAVLNCEAAAVLLLDERAGALRFSAATGGAGAALVGTLVPLDGSLAGRTLCEDRVLHVAAADSERSPRSDATTGFVTRALLGVPMRIDGQPVGVLQALNPRVGAFTRDDAEALLVVAAQAAVAIRDARQQEALRRANDQLAELDRLRTNFLSITSHELRTPITAIRGFGQILVEEVPDALRDYAQDVVEAGERMMDVVETLDVMAGTQGALGVHPARPVSVARVLADAAAEAGPDVAVALLDGPLPVAGDGARLRLAFGNLVRNAVRFSPPGGAVHVGARVQGDDVLVRVADAGRGLAAADLERIFEPYVQVADPDCRDHEGLGVGLTVARAVVVQHGGRVWAESPGPGRGATFHVRLPLAGGGA